ncbi:MAG TPA: hypothetical protein VK828_16275 [Terriglobales bacterium]|jgi:hypothetical protein|nr:hypothetical protein [Terriglobales bacterium]
MFLWSESDDRVAIVKMNAELQHAQLELLSAECATNRLRLRFSPENLARYAERDLLRKAVASATALKDYYSYIARQASEEKAGASSRTSFIPEEKVVAAIDSMREYLQERRKEYRPQGLPLSPNQYTKMKSFFSPALLAEVRVIELRGRHINNPPFYAEARALGLTNLPEVAHMASLTFDDTVIFPREINDRRLFHALVHAAQFEILGFEGYAESFVRGFLRVRSHISVPLEMQAFNLEAKFAEKPHEAFSVEEIISLWVKERRY